jgi:hypothetical protein
LGGGLIALSKALLVILIGIYAIRSTWFIFSGSFSPLTPVAAAVLILCIISFHRLPLEIGTWFYVLISICVLGAIANASLLFSTSPIYANPTNMTFSAISLGCFVLLGAVQLWSVLKASG